MLNNQKGTRKCGEPQAAVPARGRGIGEDGWRGDVGGGEILTLSKGADQGWLKFYPLLDATM